MKKEADNRIPLTDRQLALIERMGVMHSKDGMQPSPARVIGLLMVSDKTELTFDEIRETLELSKSATSNALNLLLKIKHVDYITKTGDRKRYFKSNIEIWKRQFFDQFEKLNKFCDILEEIHSVRTSKTADFNRSISELHDFIRYFLKEIPSIYQKWESLKNK